MNRNNKQITLLLAYLEGRRDKGASAKDVSAALGNIVSISSWTTSDAEALAAKALELGLVESMSPRARTFRISAGGSRATRDYLRFEPKARPDWKAIYAGALTARVAGLPAPPIKRSGDAFPAAKGLFAALANIELALGLPDYPTLRAARDRWSWRALRSLRDFDASLFEDRLFSIKAVSEALLGSQFEDAHGVRYKDPAETLLLLCLAKALGGGGTDAASIRRAVFKRWMDRDELTGLELPPTPIASSPTTSSVASAGSVGLASFAEELKALARAVPPWTPGADKVFISSLFRAYSASRPEPETDLEQFKALLLDAHRARLLSLSEANLRAAMDPRDVNESALPFHTATYHLVRVLPER